MIIVDGPETKNAILPCTRCRKPEHHEFAKREPMSCEEGEAYFLIFSCQECSTERVWGTEFFQHDA